MPVNNLYCLLTEAHVCKQFAQDCTLRTRRLAVNPTT